MHESGTAVPAGAITWSPEPRVELVKHFPDAYRNFLATARTCYSSKGIIEDNAIDGRWDELARSLYRAGHHTTLQHAHFQFALDRVSRQFVWSFLHSHPFYNSEQVSQRYVKVRPGAFAVPPVGGEARAVYERSVHFLMERYELLRQRLLPAAEAQYRKRFPKRPLDSKTAKSDIQKKAQEVARYVLPLSTLCYMYHTVSGVTLMRYYRLCKLFDAPAEQTLVAGKMVAALLEREPKFKVILEEPLEPDLIPEWSMMESLAERKPKAFIREFDAALEGRVSRLVDYKMNNERMVASAVREVFGLTRDQMDDGEALEAVLNPGRNRLLGEALNLGTLSKLTRCLVHASYTFRKKLSHTGDSQDQRHRMTPASRPILAAHMTDEPDFITPELIKTDESVWRLYNETMARAWDQISEFRRQGGNSEFAQYLLPNAVAVRFTESADLLNLHHKHAMRLCYNAQEEIWRASLDEAKQVCEVNPRIGRYLLPPCTLRELGAQRPICPEGARFCGEKVWNYPLEEFERVI